MNPFEISPPTTNTTNNSGFFQKSKSKRSNCELCKTDKSESPPERLEMGELCETHQQYYDVICGQTRNYYF
eukprot:UN27803